jgi:beta-glucanase (GH16 family)
VTRRRPRGFRLAVAAGLAATLAACTRGSGTFDGPTAGDPDVGQSATPPTGVPGDWRPVFSDGFLGPKLDRAMWQPSRYGGSATGEAPFNPSIENAWFSTENVAVRDGALVLTLEERSRRLHGREYAYSSGVVSSAPGVLLEEGSYIEARIRVPRCDGCWPAFWAVPPDAWPPEVDIMEYFNTGTQERPMFNYIDPSDERTGPEAYGPADLDGREAWHVYGLLWTGERLVPYLDGQPAPEVAATEDLPDRGLSVILNLSVRDGMTPDTDAAMQVDWVRVWHAQS